MKRYDRVRQFLEESGLNDPGLPAKVDGRFMSAFIRARKPVLRASCCDSTCCA